MGRDATERSVMGRSAVMSSAMALATQPVRERWLDVDIRNAENVPSFGGAIIAANHLSFIDSMLLMYGLDRPVSFVGKAEYLDSFVTRNVFPAIGMIPIDRSGRGLATTLRECRKRLDDGELVGIFPEGTRSRTGHLQEGHSGVAHLSLVSGAPIVPVGIVGTDEALPIGERRLRRSPITINIGRMIGPRPEVGRPSMRDRLELTDEVMQSIASLSGQVRETSAPQRAAASTPLLAMATANATA